MAGNIRLTSNDTSGNYRLTSTGSSIYVWRGWNTSSTASTNADLLWTSSTSSTGVSTSWGPWNDYQDAIQSYQDVMGRKPDRGRRLTADELRAQAAAEQVAHEAHVARQLAYEAEAAMLRAKAAMASKRAYDLLKRELTDEQKKDLAEKGSFYLEVFENDGRRRRFRIDKGSHGNVKELNAAGSVIHSFCGQPRGVPEADAMLGQLLYLKNPTLRAEYERVSNVSAPGGGLISPSGLPLRRAG